MDIIFYDLIKDKERILKTIKNIYNISKNDSSCEYDIFFNYDYMYYVLCNLGDVNTII